MTYIEHQPGTRLQLTSSDASKMIGDWLTAQSQNGQYVGAISQARLRLHKDYKIIASSQKISRVAASLGIEFVRRLGHKPESARPSNSRACEYRAISQDECAAVAAWIARNTVSLHRQYLSDRYLSESCQNSTGQSVAGFTIRAIARSIGVTINYEAKDPRKTAASENDCASPDSRRDIRQGNGQVASAYFEALESEASARDAEIGVLRMQIDKLFRLVADLQKSVAIALAGSQQTAGPA